MIFHVYAGPSSQNCAWCKQAKNLLEEKGQVYKYYNVTETVSREDFMELFDKKGIPTPRSVPQIFVEIGNELHYIGGFTELSKSMQAAYS